MHCPTYRRLWSSSVRSPCGPPADWTAVTSPEWPASPYCLSARCTGTGPCHGFSVKPKHKHQSAVTTYTPQDNLYKTSQVQQSSYLKGGKHTFSRKDNQKLNALHIKYLSGYLWMSHSYRSYLSMMSQPNGCESSCLLVNDVSSYKLFLSDISTQWIWVQLATY